MCRTAHETCSDEELYFRYLSKRSLTPLVLSPIYNLCRTQTSPVLRLVAGERRFDQMRWQLVPGSVFPYDSVGALTVSL
jgi:putative SOS response-associated peptidase YedK